jgi:hypothetical protein
LPYIALLSLLALLSRGLGGTDVGGQSKPRKLQVLPLPFRAQVASHHKARCWRKWAGRNRVLLGFILRVRRSAQELERIIVFTLGMKHPGAGDLLLDIDNP